MKTDKAEQESVSASTKFDKSLGMQAEGIDFDLSSFSMDDKDEEVDNDSTPSDVLLDLPTQIAPSNEEQAFESFDFDFSSSNAETTGLDDFDFSGIDNIDKTNEEVDFSGDKSLDVSDDFDFDFKMPSSKSGQDDEFGVSDLTDMDELETKLDLAKAYVDMGDTAAAKDLAREVLKQGTDEQKKTAQSLLDELE
jgi:pilus assembly protein FimV